MDVQIKPGVHYGDPFTDVEVTAQDFIRALEREANPKANVGGYPFYYSVIKGFDEFAAGEADSIAGLSAPDASTLQIELTAADGRPRATGWRCRRPLRSRRTVTRAWAPPRATTRTTDGSWWRPGPYKFEGAEQMDFSRARRRPEPVAGYEPGSSIVLGAQPGLGPGDRRPASGVSGPDRGRDRRQQRRPLQPDQVERAGLRRGRRRAAGDHPGVLRPTRTSRAR